MAMICPRCRSLFEQRFSCPNCDVRLEYIDPRALGRRHRSRFSMNWQHTPWGRTLVALLLAQGLYYGLRHLLCSALLRVLPDGAAPDQTGQLWIIVLLQTTQLVSLILGGVVAGANQRHGVLQGAVLGVINGILSSVLHPTNFPAPTTVVFYGTPLLQACFGALGAWVGYMIWTPLPEQPLPENEAAQNKPKKVSPPLFKGPVAWHRVGFGIFIGAVGYLSARMILEAVVNNSLKTLATETLWQERLITWEIQALAVLAGAWIAGSNCFNGLKQGLCVGVVLSLLVVAYLALKAAHVEIVAVTAVGCLVLSLLGGYFGCQLFPPVSRHGRTRGMGPATAH